MDRGWSGQGLDAALADDHDAGDKGDREEDVHETAGKVDPEIPDGGRSSGEKTRATMAMATAMPTAGVTNCCTVREPIWEKYDMVVSPA